MKLSPQNYCNVFLTISKYIVIICFVWLLREPLANWAVTAQNLKMD